MVPVILAALLVLASVPAPKATSQTEVLDRIASLDGHLLVTDEAGALADYGRLARRIAAVAGVRSVVPILEGLAGVSRANTLAGSLAGVRVIGVRADDLANIPYAGVARPQKDCGGSPKRPAQPSAAG